MTKPKGTNAFNRIYREYSYRAILKSRDWKLTKTQFKKLIGGNCYYCGAPPSNVCSPLRCNGSYIYNGVDRLDNNKGYTIDNVVSCCKECNIFKGVKSAEYFISHIKKIALNLTT